MDALGGNIRAAIEALARTQGGAVDSLIVEFVYEAGAVVHTARPGAPGAPQGHRPIGGLGQSKAPTPQGAMYAFFRIPGHPDSVALAKRLIRQAKLGLAPGAAFGPEGEGWLRWCFAAETSSLEEGLARLERWLGARAT